MAILQLLVVTVSVAAVQCGLPFLHGGVGFGPGGIRGGVGLGGLGGLGGIGAMGNLGLGGMGNMGMGGMGNMGMGGMGMTSYKEGESKPQPNLGGMGMTSYKEGESTPQPNLAAPANEGQRLEKSQVRQKRALKGYHEKLDELPNPEQIQQAFQAFRSAVDRHLLEEVLSYNPAPRDKRDEQDLRYKRGLILLEE